MFRLICVVTLLLIGCSSEESGTVNTELPKDNQSKTAEKQNSMSVEELKKLRAELDKKIAEKQPVKKNTIMLNGMTVTPAGNMAESEKVRNYLREKYGIVPGYSKTDKIFTTITPGVMATTDKSETALSQCVATSGLRALKMGLEFLYSNIEVSETITVGPEGKSSKIRPTIVSKMTDTSPAGKSSNDRPTIVTTSGLPLLFETDEGFVGYTFNMSEGPTVNRIVSGKVISIERSSNVSLANAGGPVCSYSSTQDENGLRQEYTCDIQQVNRLFRHEQKRSEQNIVASWITSELGDSACSSAFFFRFGSRFQ